MARQHPTAGHPLTRCTHDGDAVAGPIASISSSRSVAHQPILSVVVPLLNEEAVLEQTYERLTEQLEALELPYEIIFVDDGSTDRSRPILAAMSLADPHVTVIGLSRNFGHEMATTAGLRHVRGQAAVVIDADLQDPPELIRDFVAHWRNGYHVVFGVRQERKGETMLKKLTSFLFYRLMGKIADVPMPADTGDFRLMDRRVLNVYQQLREDPRFFRGLVSWIGFKQVGVPFVRSQRAAGQTKYRYGRLVKLAFDTITAFSTLPAHFITLSAWFTAAGSFLFTVCLLVVWILGGVALESWIWAGLGCLALFNMQFISLAVLGEYIVRTHRHTQRRPLYVIDEVIKSGKPVAPVDRRSRKRRRRVPHAGVLGDRELTDLPQKG